MPRYFFDSRDDDAFISDDIGGEYPDFEAAKAEAARALADLAKEVLPSSLRRELAIEVRGDQGPVLIALMKFEAIIVRPL